jgi:hypothetical protein
MEYLATPVVLSPDLHWKRITWTFLGNNAYRSWYIGQAESIIPSWIQALVLPASCEELNLEFQYLWDRPTPLLYQMVTELCTGIRIRRADSTFLDPEPSSPVEYRWNRLCKPPESRGTVRCVRRIQWRSQVSQKEYMRYDQVDCLDSKQMTVIPRGASQSRKWTYPVCTIGMM